MPTRLNSAPHPVNIMRSRFRFKAIVVRFSTLLQRRPPSGHSGEHGANAKTDSQQQTKPPDPPVQSTPNLAPASKLPSESPVYSTSDGAEDPRGDGSVTNGVVPVTEDTIQKEDELRNLEDPGGVPIGLAGPDSENADNLHEGNANHVTNDSMKGALLKGVARRAFDTAKALSEAFPPFKVAVGCVEVLVHLADSHSENKEALVSLGDSLNRVRSLVKIEPSGEEEARRQNDLRLTLQKVSDDFEHISRQGTLQMILAIEDIASVIKKSLADIEQALRTYEVSLLQAMCSAAEAQLGMLKELREMGTEQRANDDIQLLNIIPRVTDAEFGDKSDRPYCLDDTRVEILRELRQWATNPESEQVCWLNGHAGSGKTTIAQSFAMWLTNPETQSPGCSLGATFFCSRNSPLRKDLTKIFPSIARQLAAGKDYHSLRFRRELIVQLQSDDRNMQSSNMAIQLRHLIVHPARNSDLETIILIDSLDECEDRDGTKLFLTSLAENLPNMPKIKVFVTSRSEVHIEEGFRRIYDKLHPEKSTNLKNVDLDKVDPAAVESDIRLFIEKRLESIANAARERGLSIAQDWPGRDRVEALGRISERLFIFASIAISAIENSATRDDPVRQLDHLTSRLDHGPHSTISTRKDHPYHALNRLYLRILDDAFSSETEDSTSEVHSILGLLAVACEPLSRTAIRDILGSTTDIALSNILSQLRSVLVVPSNSDDPVAFRHKSFVDFLTDDQRRNERFYIDPKEHHLKTALNCFKLLQAKLKKNILQLTRYSSNKDLKLKPAQLHQVIDEATKYSCRYWADHLLGDDNLDFCHPDVTPLLNFMIAKHQLRWLEVIGALDELHKAVDTLSKLRKRLGQAPSNDYKNLMELILDGERFILFAFDTIKESVLHMYHSAILWVPQAIPYTSLIKDDLVTEARVVIGVPTHWAGNFRTINMPGEVLAIEYSHNGSLLAAAGQGFSRLVYASTGGDEAVLETSPEDQINSLAFRPDDKVLATAPGRHIQLWDVATHALFAEMCGHSASIRKIIFHPEDVNLLLSMDRHGHICLWRTTAPDGTEEVGPPSAEFTVKGANAWGAVCWVPGSEQKIIAIGSEEGHVELWDVTQAAKGGYPPQGPQSELKSSKLMSSSVDAVAVSNDGTFVLAGSDGSIAIYNRDSGELVHHVTTAEDTPAMYSLILSPKFKNNPDDFLAYTHANEVGLFYPLRKDNRVIRFLGHSDHVKTVTFSPDGQLITTGSYDGTIRIWDTNEQDVTSASDHHKSRVKCAHFSLDGNYIVSGSVDRTVRIWDATGGMCCRVLRGHSSMVLDAVFLTNDTSNYVVSREEKGTLILWDWRREPDDAMLYKSPDPTRSSDSVQRTAAPDQDYGVFRSNFPFTHGPLGFFSSYILDSGDLPGWMICCWEVNIDSLSSNPLRVVAQGSIPIEGDFVVRVFHQSSSIDCPSAITVECASGRRYNAPWPNCETFPEASSPPDTLSFEQDHASPLPLVISEWDSYVGSEEHCSQTKDKDWVLDEEERKILWVAPIHRGTGRWWKKEKLLLEGDSGRLTLLDFKNVSLNVEDQL